MRNKEIIRRDTEELLNEAGYTLIEIMIVLLLVAFGFIGSYQLFVTSLRADTESRHEIIAGELLQEGLEIIKNKKEENDLKWAIWSPSDGDEPKLNEGMPGNDFNPIVDFDAKTIGFETNHFNLQYDLDRKEYVLQNNCSNCVGPVFERRCSQTLNSDEDTLTASCTVSWQSVLAGGERRIISAKTALTDWER